jgi:hypothetical protein
MDAVKQKRQEPVRHRFGYCTFSKMKENADADVAHSTIYKK